ncbi:LysR family transcriptional regulator [Aliiruegeria haliotis]|uniref:LysR family transcriptional regulator n=1 Tax=Aliiruegeria haliotis TaxID=1280846 RepID=A0A2T0RQW5_9RHOB|nr:LysR substrate-binding domain-containing protein [Aliiruegeria haliotis]PRY23584.1 LysR family transcriptional regulator [Aliiruegeria haliotis]
MSVTLRQLRYLLAVAEHGQISRAAEAVHVSQPALSVQIRDMEAALGVVLLERLPRRVVLTPAGHEIVDHARRVMSELGALERSARVTSGLSGRLALGMIPTVAPYLIPAALPLLRAQNVGLDLRVREATTEELLNDLTMGRLDAAVVALPSGEDGLTEMPLFEDRFLLAGSSTRIEALLAEGRVPDPSSLTPRQLLLLDEGHCLADQALEACSLDRRDTRVDLGASSLSTLSGLVAGGFGLTFMPEIALAKELSAAPEMRLTRFPAPEPKRAIGLVRRESARGQGWFEDLWQLLKMAGEGLVAEGVAAARGACAGGGETA